MFHLNTFWSLEKCSWKSAKLDDKGKSRPNGFFHWILPVFLKFVFSTTTYVIQKGSQILHSFAWVLCKTWKRLADVDNLDETSREEIGQNRFSRQKIAFLENIFWRLSHSYRNNLISYKLYNKCRMTSWTLTKRFLRFVKLGSTRRKKLTFFFIGMFAFLSFFQNILFSTTYHFFENWPFYLHQICLNTLWSVIKLLWTSAKLGITREKIKVSFSLKR